MCPVLMKKNVCVFGTKTFLEGKTGIVLATSERFKDSEILRSYNIKSPRHILWGGPPTLCRCVLLALLSHARSLSSVDPTPIHLSFLFFFPSFSCWLVRSRSFTLPLSPFLSLPSSLLSPSLSLLPWRSGIFKLHLMRFRGSMDSYFSCCFGNRISQVSKVTNIERVSNFERLTCGLFSSFALLLHFFPFRLSLLGVVLPVSGSTNVEH